MRITVIVAVALASSFLMTGNARAERDFEGLSQYFEQARKQWHVPALSVAIVEDGEVVFSRGYGVCRVGGESQVTDETVFAIGSCSKSFTSTAMGLLVSQKELHWDDPVRRHLPDFELFDPFVTREVTIRDLLAHRTGLKLADLLWSKGEFTSDEIMRRLKHVKPKRSFRDRFTYNNLMYLTAGRILEQRTDNSWDEVIDRSILQPLEMQSTSTFCPADREIAWPHHETEGATKPIELERDFAVSIAPAGALWSTAADMAKWIRWNLSAGRDDVHPAIHTDALTEMQSPQSVIPVRNQGTTYPRKEYASHGLGWFVEDYRGRKLVRNSGSSNGYISWVSMLPEEDFGFVILSNSHRTWINFALHLRILDEYLGEPTKDWSTIARNGYTNGWKKTLREARVEYEKQRRSGTKTSVPLSHFVGTYRSDLFGDLTVQKTAAGLRFRFGHRRIAILEHWQDDTFQADFPHPMVEDWHVDFKVSDNGEVESLNAVAAPWAPAWYDDGTVVGEFRKLNSS